MERRTPRTTPRTRLAKAAACVALASLLAACAGPGPLRPEQTETRDESGFRITEEVRVGLGVRSDFERAVEAVDAGDYARGIELLVEVTGAAPHVTAAHIDLAIAYRLAGDLPKAEASLRRALELNPRHPVAHNELGIVQRRSGRFAEARASYEKALDLQPDFHFARRNLAILCDLYLEDDECALSQYQSYVEAFPHDEEVAMWMADLKNRMGSN
ncbi:MAG: tetratricopeptide repeat protein [Myxococcota bacterium]